MTAFGRVGVAAAAVVAALLLAAPASADRAPTLAEALAVADAWAAKVAPGNVNRCAGQLRVEWTGDLGYLDGRRVRGDAPGWVLVGGEYVWDSSRCVVRLLASGDAFERCYDLVHEVLHYVVGPEHVGPLAPDFPHVPPCIVDEPPRADLFRAIAAGLPASRGPWRVGCTRNSRRMRCKASSPRARTRRFTASIVGAGYTLSPAGEISWRP